MHKRIQKTALFLCLVALALTFQGCPGTTTHEDFTREGYIFAPLDSIFVKYHRSEGKGFYEDFEYICPPNSQDVYSQVAWRRGHAMYYYQRESKSTGLFIDGQIFIHRP